MRVLVGTHLKRIDPKGRVSVPKVFRDVLQALGGTFSGVFVYPLFKDSAVEGCGEEFMHRLSESLDELSMFSEDQDELGSVLLESAHQLPFDPEGRIVLPDEMISHAKIDGEVLFVGRGKRFQIWNPGLYYEKRNTTFERLKKRAPTLKLKSSGLEE